ncbi:hypothetical protein BDB00DRAFT_843739 [Zychaea mexicana]|uniref:uncharacterized protein n=1 Tax=Zychaea mexicana TaxID=64656 RepID=UPI0022FE2CA9|nr:uncharacterized protein BDB00DRAFT_843739 [Zychaea mexicana]KAI9489290.1 hypothetical protein BDB00DRAFT_843739 [Zychaea mexicana]
MSSSAPPYHHHHHNHLLHRQTFHHFPPSPSSSDKPSSGGSKHYSNKRHTSQLERLLSRAPPQANFNVNYDTYTILIPNYTFGKPTLLPGSGGLMAIAIGKRLSDGLPVLVKLSPYAIRLEREYYIARRLYTQPDGKRYIPQVVELQSLPQDGLTALIYADKGASEDLTYAEQRYFSHYRLWVTSPTTDDMNKQLKEEVSTESEEEATTTTTDGAHSESNIDDNSDKCNNGSSSSPLLDIETFLNFAVECCSCLQLLHANGIIHGELRPSAFHWHKNSSMTVKIWNFGAGLKSFEDILLTSSGWRRAVMAAAAHDDLLDDPTIVDPLSASFTRSSPRGFQNALAYVSPEQTGRTSNVLDHRTDLYSLGIMFFVILTGSPPFDGSPMSVIQAALSQNVPLVHTIRPDVPPVVSLIIDKLTRKAVDERYNSAYGVREDLIECLRRFKRGGCESLVFFPLGLHDINSVFQFPNSMYGRDQEIELLRAATRRSANDNNHVQQQRYDDEDDEDSSPTRMASPSDRAACEVVVITGPGGIGKSTLVSSIHNYARQYGYLGSSKFDSNQKRPYNGLLRCLSSILRQLLTEPEAVIHDFYEDLKRRLGPHFSNVRLMVDMVPELKPILSDHGRNTIYDDMLPNISTESRFHAVFLNVIKTIMRKKTITLCLDDLHEADEPSLHLISNLISARIKMLIVLTCRDKIPDCIQEEIDPEDNPDARVTSIRLTPLAADAILQLVSQTLHQTPEAVQQLADIVFQRTHGNPFYAKQLMLMMKRKGDIWLDWDEKQWKFRLDNANQMLFPPAQQQQQQSATSSSSSSSNKDSIGGGTGGGGSMIDGVLDVRYLVSHLRDLDHHTQAFLMWASLIGSVFDFRQIKWLMMATDLVSSLEDSCSDLSDNVSIVSGDAADFVDALEHAPTDAYHTPPANDDHKLRDSQAMAGLQTALQEGIIQPKVGNNEYQFCHDRYCQASSMLVDDKDREKMHLRIGQMLMIDNDSSDVFLTADHFVKSADLIKRFRARAKYRHILVKAGEEALNSGALQIARIYYECAMSLLALNPWDEESMPDVSYRETLDLHMRMAELDWWSNKREEANALLDTIMAHTQGRPVERAQAWRVQARMYFQLQQNDRGIEAIIDALRELGMDDIRSQLHSPMALPADHETCAAEAYPLYSKVKKRILEIGFDRLIAMERCRDRRILAIMTLLNEACTGAIWLSPTLVDTIAIKLVELSLEHGYGVTSGSGFIWLGCTAARLKEYKFGAQLGELGLQISEKYAGNPEIAQSIVVHYGMLAQWSSNCHFRDCIKHFQRAYKYAVAGGDKIFSSMALFHISTTLFYTGCNLSELQTYLSDMIEEYEEDDMKKDTIFNLNVSLWRSVLALQGKTSTDSGTTLDDPNQDENGFTESRRSRALNPSSPFHWHWSLNIITLVHFDRHCEAARLGFHLFETSLNHPEHRHIGIAIFYHSIAMIACIRDTNLDDATRENYRAQVERNQQTLDEWATQSEINYRMYYKLVEAELSTLDGSWSTPNLYNDAIELGTQGQWHPFLALAYQLTAEHYIRSNMKMLALPMLQQSLEIYNAWDAWGTARHLSEKHSSILDKQTIIGKPVDASTQTADELPNDVVPAMEQGIIWEDIMPEPSIRELYGEEEATSCTSETAILSLDIVDLTSIIKSSQVISNEMNSFDELLKKMMQIIMTNSAAESGAIIIKEGSFGIAAHSSRLTGCETFDPPKLLTDDGKDGEDLISTLVVHYVIHTQTILFIPNIMEDTRFATGTWFARSGPKSVICMPCIHKNTLVGVLYLQANLNTFTHKHVTVLHILCHQIGISITNALLFKSVQKATMANTRMIAKQREALEEARSSREQALKAAELKSNFLANMSHELRTPFSGFYGMIELLSDTRLDPEQKEFVFIAKQSCEMLLQIIDDLLDFSKLEAHKVKLHHGLFYVEDLIEDRVELLITLASNKNLELTCFTDPDVPLMIYADGNRIGQILMNLIGNAIKFTMQGEVVVRCSVEKETDQLSPPLNEDEIMLRFSVQDTGIGMTKEQTKSLFVPFSQVDGSTTRNFGGTGLGLSICLELVRLMGGDVWVESDINTGSTFYFRVRVMKSSSAVEPGIDSDRRSREIDRLAKLLGQPRLLLSTSPRQGAMIRSLLPSTVTTTCVPSVQHVIECARASAQQGEPYNCILIDAPPHETLRCLLDATEQDPDLRNLQIIVIYAPAMESIRHQLASNKFIKNESTRITRITKPIRRAKLFHTLLQVLGLEAPAATAFTAAESTPMSQTLTSRIPTALARHIHESISGDDMGDSKKQHPKEYHQQQLSHPLDTTAPPTPIAHNEPHEIKPSFSSPYTNQGFTPEELAMFKDQRILVAEDNFVAQKLIRRQLEKFGFTVESVGNGVKAVEAWCNHSADYYTMALFDHHMPTCDGVEAAKKIRKIEASRKGDTRLTILALTADIQKSACDNAIRAGMDGYLTKPLNQTLLIEVIRRYCTDIQN